MCPHPDVVGRQLGDELVLVHLGTGRFYTLNGTAARIWSLMATGCDAEAICARLAQEFDVDGSVLSDQVRDLLDSFSEEGLLRDDALV